MNSTLLPFLMKGNKGMEDTTQKTIDTLYRFYNEWLCFKSDNGYHGTRLAAEYRDAIAGTAFYAGKGKANAQELGYLVMGAIAEHGEMVEEWDHGRGSRNAVLLEVGDVMWYLVQLDSCLSHVSMKPYYDSLGLAIWTQTENCRIEDIELYVEESSEAVSNLADVAKTLFRKHDDFNLKTIPDSDLKKLTQATRTAIDKVCWVAATCKKDGVTATLAGNALKLYTRIKEGQKEDGTQWGQKMTR